jgi:hypothetical protein
MEKQKLTCLYATTLVNGFFFFFFFLLKTSANVCIVGTLVNVKNLVTCLSTTTLVNGIFLFYFLFSHLLTCEQ